MNPTSPPTLEYREECPRGYLALRVRRLWALRAPTGGIPVFEPVLPDGCPELVFNLAEPFERAHPGFAERQPAVLLAGQMLGPLLIRPTGAVDLVGVRFHPWGARRLGDVAVQDLVDRILPPDAVCGIAGLRDALAAASSLEHRLRLLEEQLTRRFRAAADEPPSPVRALASGVGSVSLVARQAGISPRHLERLSRDWVGLPPGQLVRLRRFQRALRGLRLRPAVPLARMALETGFADQAHLTREFRRYSGMTPSQFRLGVGHLTESFIEARTADEESPG
jgi:AraC-like DNA-binding protein